MPQAHACLGTRILCPSPKVMRAYIMIDAPMGLAHACCHQDHLRLGVLFSRRSMLGVLLPQKPMNTYGLYSKSLLQGEEADQEGASHPRLVQFSSILLHPRCWISGSN